MRRVKWANVVAFTIIVSGDNLNELRSKSKKLFLLVIPEQVAIQYLVLAVRDFKAIVSEEP